MNRYYSSQGLILIFALLGKDTNAFTSTPITASSVSTSTSTVNHSPSFIAGHQKQPFSFMLHNTLVDSGDKSDDKDDDKDKKDSSVAIEDKVEEKEEEAVDEEEEEEEKDDNELFFVEEAVADATVEKDDVEVDAEIVDEKEEVVEEESEEEVVEEAPEVEVVEESEQTILDKKMMRLAIQMAQSRYVMFICFCCASLSPFNCIRKLL